MRSAAVVSFRLGGSDGVSVEAAKWAWALGRLGFAVTTVAGEGPVDVLVPGLAMGAALPPRPDEVEAALGGADLVVVENLCSLPLNPAASAVVSGVLAGRPALFHHHDLPWQRAHLAHHPPPPDDPAWRHVTINELSRHQLARHGVEAVTVYNTFDPDPAPGRRAEARAAMGVDADAVVVLQPTRALPRKNVAGGLSLAEALGGTYWLLGPDEDGYGPELERLLALSSVPVVRGRVPLPRAAQRRPWEPAAAGMEMADAYAACDVVTLPSTWEGFGNPSVESATHRRPLAVGPYVVAAELSRFGFEWFAADDPWPLRGWLDEPDAGVLDVNAAVAREHFCVHDLPERLRPIVDSLS